MACGMIVQLPAATAFGTDVDFDLRTLLEREISAALGAHPVAECGRGEIEGGRMSVRLDAVADHAVAFRLVTGVLSRLKQLDRAVVVLETRSDSDPDDTHSQTLWPVAAPAARVA